MFRDWTFDLFMEDCNLYNATPRRGVYPRRDASDREKFMTWFKGCARDFREEWSKTNKGDYDSYNLIYIGDAFIKELSDMCFSDYYKEVYGQRPHLDKWFYVKAIGLSTGSDVIRTFCARPFEDAIERAKEAREYLRNM